MANRVKIDRALLSDFDRNKLLAKYLGMFPMEVSQDGLVLSSSGLACTLLMMSSVLALAGVQWYSPSSMFGAGPAEVFLNVLQWVTMNCAVISLAIKVIRRRSVLYFIIFNLTACKDAVQKADVPWKPYSPYLISLSTIIFSFMFMFFDLSVSVASTSDAFYVIAYYYTAILNIGALSQFLWLAFNLAEAFRGLRIAIDRRSDYADLEYLIKFHLVLSECCKRLNDVYSLEFLLSVASAAAIALSDAHHAAMSIKRSDDAGSIAIYLLWTFNGLYLCFRLINACEYLKTQVKEFDDSLYEKIVRDNNKTATEPSQALNVFLHFISHQPIEFKMFKFTEMNWKMLFSIIVGGSAYLVFLIQVNLQ